MWNLIRLLLVESVLTIRDFLSVNTGSVFSFIIKNQINFDIPYIWDSNFTLLIIIKSYESFKSYDFY
jgi:hypothetical protein